MQATWAGERERVVDMINMQCIYVWNYHIGNKNNILKIQISKAVKGIENVNLVLMDKKF